jgi:hypothetical protein
LYLKEFIFFLNLPLLVADIFIEAIMVSGLGYDVPLSTLFAISTDDIKLFFHSFGDNTPFGYSSDLD